MPDFDVDYVPYAVLAPHPRNPQQGDVTAVLTSIAVGGWHGTVTVRRIEGPPPYLQILVGHTRWRALMKLAAEGWDDATGIRRSYSDLAAAGVDLPPKGSVPVQYVDLDDVAAARKMLADNRASDLSLVDADELRGLLADLDDQDALYGSLYTATDFRRLAATAEGFARDTASEGLTPEDRRAAFEATGLRSVILPLPAADYDQLVAAMNMLRDAWDVPTLVEVAQRAVREAADATP